LPDGIKDNTLNDAPRFDLSAETKTPVSMTTWYFVIREIYSPGPSVSSDPSWFQLITEFRLPTAYLLSALGGIQIDEIKLTKFNGNQVVSNPSASA